MGLWLGLWNSERWKRVPRSQANTFGLDLLPFNYRYFQVLGFESQPSVPNLHKSK